MKKFNITNYNGYSYAHRLTKAIEWATNIKESELNNYDPHQLIRIAINNFEKWNISNSLGIHNSHPPALEEIKDIYNKKIKYEKIKEKIGIVLDNESKKT